MKERTDHYPFYKKLVRLQPEKRVEEAIEYKALAERYPHLAESIRLRREMERLNEKLKSVKERTARFQIEREMNRIRAKLKRESILKRLHGESKQETTFHMHFIIDASKERLSSLAKRGHTASRKAYTNAQKRLRKFTRRKLPPSIFDLKSLDVAERGLALREWIQKRRKQP